MPRFILYICASLFLFQACSKRVELNHLRVEYKANPEGITAEHPRLSWQLISDERDVKQTAYRVLVSDNLKALENNEGNLWDSGKVPSDQSIQVNYEGLPLKAAHTYYWKVMVWSNVDESKWSDINTWQMGLFKSEDWNGAKWIALDELEEEKVDVLPESGKKDTWHGNNVLPLLRKEFQIEKKVKKATLFISGLGHFEAYLNGQKIGDHFLDAGWVKYDKEALYVTFDITDNLNQGENAMGVMLGNGFYFIPPVKGRFRKQKVAFGYPKMICRMVVEYDDGSTSDLISDESWRASAGPITFSSLYGGEDYDARLEQDGWDQPGFNDTDWQTAITVKGSPELNSQMAYPLRVFDNFTAKEIIKTPNNEWVYDLAQNASGIIELKVKGQRGDTVRVYPGELMADGAVTQKATGGPYYFEYVLKSDKEETWRPRFTYYGFRYLQVKGAVPTGMENPSSRPEVLELKGLHTRNATNRVGSFCSSNDLFNRTDTLIDWAIKSNMASVFTDCPHREKLGWLEQIHLVGPSIKYNYDMANIGDKIINDMMNSQLPSGLVPEIAPEYVNFTWGGDMFRDSPEWGSTSIIFPWYLYKWYGDEQVLVKAYPMMKRYINYLENRSEGLILKQGLGDWFDLGPERPGVSQLTPMGVTGTAIFYYDLTIISQIAEKLGEVKEAAEYRKLAQEVRKAFNEAFFNNETKQYATNSQTANAMAVYMELVEPEFKDAVVENIIKDIRSRDNSFTTGDIGHRYLLKVLENEGRSDVIFDMNSRDDVPGYGYQLAKGATALTESWQALPNVSNNHLMLGHLMEWFYSGLAGIRQAKDGIGFNKIEIYPNPVGDVNAAEGSYESPYGIIKSKWEKNDYHFTLDVAVPANSSALVYLPGDKNSVVTEGGKTLANVGLDQIEYANDRIAIKVGSGNYSFKVKQTN